MNKIEFLKDKIPFTQVANGVLTDKRISAKAKGLYAYLYSKPDGWNFAIDRIALEMADGRKSINEGLHELEEYGFLTRKKQADGRVVYLVHFPPIEPNDDNGHLGTEPDDDFGKVPKRQSAKTGTISNKDSIIIKNLNNKEFAETSSATNKVDSIAEIIKAFSDLINPACKTMYGNTTQRGACQNLIDTYTFEKVMNTVTFLQKSNKVLFHKATTPLQLWNKWIDIQNEVETKYKKHSVPTV